MSLIISESIFEELSEGVFILDHRGRYLYANSSWKRLSGISEEDVETLSLEKSFHPDRQNEILKLWEGCRTAQQTLQLESRVIDTDDKELDVVVKISPLREGSEGEGVQFIGVVVDLTERKKIESEKQQVVELKSKLASIITHELRTPLTAIQESVNLIYDETFGSINEKQKKFLDLSRKNVDRLHKLFDDMMKYREIQKGDLEFFPVKANLNTAIEAVFNEMKPKIEEKGIRASLNLDVEIPSILFDQDRIKLLLTHLIMNAIYFTQEGEIKVESEFYDNVVHVHVKDTGVGIGEGDISKVFQSFEQTGGNSRKLGGVGLGLSICYEIIHRHRGKIWVESKEGAGSDFQFTLPIKDRRG